MLKNNVILCRDIKENGLWEGFSEIQGVSIDKETKVGYKCFRVSRPQLFNSQHLPVALFNDQTESSMENFWLAGEMTQCIGGLGVQT